MYYFIVIDYTKIEGVVSPQNVMIQIKKIDDRK
jgi:hypothetical protein